MFGGSKISRWATQEFNRATNSKVNKVLTSFERLDDTFNDRAEMLLESLVGATNTLTEVLEAAAVSLDKVNIRQELDNIPKAVGETPDENAPEQWLVQRPLPLFVPLHALEN